MRADQLATLARGQAMTSRRARRIGAALLAAAALLGIAPASAFAHAYLITTTPAVGAVVPATPPAVSLTYDEPVTIYPGALVVYDASGKRVDAGLVRHPAAPTISVALASRLPRGTYTVAWRVTSADTHVVHGVFTFSVGARGRAGSIGARLSAAARIPASLSIGFGIVRFLNLALLLLCGGGALAMALLLGDAEPRVRRLLLRTLVGCAALLVLVAVLGLPFQAAEADGTGLGGGFALSALDAVRHGRFGEVWLARAWIAALFGLLALALQLDWGRRRRIGDAALAGVGIALLATPSAAGHASVGGALKFIVDLAHVISAGAWLGGLAFVLAALAFSAGPERWPLAIRSVPRLSLLSTAAVGALAVAGLINAYLEVGAWRGLWQTTYGELLLAKGALVLPLLALGAYNNRVTVPALRGGAPSPPVRARLLRAAGTELLLLIAVVAVTAVLIDEPPAKNEVALSASVTAVHAIGPFSAQLRLSPAAVGANTIAITISSRRRHPPTIGEVDVAADAPAGSGLAPLNLTVIQVAPTRFRVAGADLRRAGRWSFVTTVRVGLRELVARIPVEISRAASAT